MPYTSVLQKLAQSLKITFENNIFSHGGNQGDSREKEVIDYLIKVMPNNYGFSSGEIFDESGTNSGQVDVIIYDKIFSTVFTDGTNKIIAPVESTYGVISVKSKMGTNELTNALDGIKRYNQLQRPLIEDGTIHITPYLEMKGGTNINLTGPKQQNINCIFAYDTTVAEKTIIQKLRDANCVDLLVVPDKFCIIGRSRNDFVVNIDHVPLAYKNISQNTSISVFIILLQIYLSKNRLKGANLQKIFHNLLQQNKL